MTPLPPLYPIVDVADESTDEWRRAVALATAVAEAGADLVQVRAKTLGTAAFTEVAGRIVRALAPCGGRVLINDRVDVALASHAAGVHLGDEDLPVDDARALLGDGAVIGYSTHAPAQTAAAPGAADYLAFGPVFDSPTKAGVRTPRGIERLAEAARSTERPLVAIGGIDLTRAAEVWRAGASSVAVISDLARADDPAALVRDYLAAHARLGDRSDAC